MDLVDYHPALNRPVAPWCSICIANFNGATVLQDCLSSVSALQGDFDIEVIVHDDASTDDSVALLREVFPYVELLASRENVGFCVGNNRMVAHARGSYILMLNNDAALYPDALSTLKRAIQAQSPEGLLTLPQYDWSTGELVDRGCLLDPFYNPIPNHDVHRVDVAMGIGACLFLRRQTMIELGGFPEWMGSIAEDMYLSCQARLRGLPMQVAQSSGYRHRQGASFGGNRISESGGLRSTYRRRHLSERNKTFVLLVCTPSPLAWILALLHVSALLLEGLLLSLIKRDTRVLRHIYLAALVAVVGDFSRILGLRRTTQRARSITIGRYFNVFTFRLRKLTLLFNHGVPKID